MDCAVLNTMIDGGPKNRYMKQKWMNRTKDR